MKPFWELVDIKAKNECWHWTGRRRGGANNQYGAYGHYQAHRYALEIKLGRKLARNEVARHTCDNPICCNPNHLIPGSYKDNYQDAKARGRIRSGNQSGCNNGNAKLTESDVAEIMERIGRGETNKSIAEDYPVGHSMISKIRTGKFWRSRQDSNL